MDAPCPWWPVHWQVGGVRLGWMGNLKGFEGLMGASVESVVRERGVLDKGVYGLGEFCSQHAECGDAAWLD